MTEVTPKKTRNTLSSSQLMYILPTFSADTKCAQRATARGTVLRAIQLLTSREILPEPLVHMHVIELKLKNTDSLEIYNGLLAQEFLFVCLFVVINPENPYFISCRGLEVNPLGVYPLR